MAATAVGYVILTLSFEREDNKWVGICVELGTSTYSRALTKTREDLSKLVIEHLNLLEEAGEREQFFEDWGIEFHREKPEPDEFRFRLPKNELLRLYHATRAHATLPDLPFYQPGVYEIPDSSPGAQAEPMLAGV